jgi:hypothetical protein
VNVESDRHIAFLDLLLQECGIHNHALTIPYVLVDEGSKTLLVEVLSDLTQ